MASLLTQLGGLHRHLLTARLTTTAYKAGWLPKETEYQSRETVNHGRWTEGLGTRGSVVDAKSKLQTPPQPTLTRCPGVTDSGSALLGSA